MSQSQMDLVASKAREIACHSWEYGVVSEALTELYNPELSFFQPPPSSQTPETQAIGLAYAQRFIRTDSPTLFDDKGSTTDPASLGHACLLLSQHDEKYRKAAERQKSTLLTNTPRHVNGAISHRAEIAELWSDFTYQAPPFLAFYAYTHSDEELLFEVVHQCMLYREVLYDQETGLWRHVEGPENEDKGKWSTGCGWTVMGLVRVLAVVKYFHSTSNNSCSSSDKHAEIEAELENAIKEILDGSMKADLDDNGLLRNYIDDSSWFGECAGSAAIASAVYRMTILCPDSISEGMIEWAERQSERVWGNIGVDGAIGQVVNPLNSRDRMPIGGSPEGQAFGVFLYAAHREWESKRENKAGL